MHIRLSAAVSRTAAAAGPFPANTPGRGEAQEHPYRGCDRVLPQPGFSAGGRVRGSSRTGSTRTARY